MKKLSEFENEDAVELLADLIEPAVEILSDTDLREAIKKGEDKISLCSIALKKHKKEVVEILALLNQTDVKKFKCNPVSIINDLVSITNDEELMSFFTMQAKEIQAASSFALTETTEAKEN